MALPPSYCNKVLIILILCRYILYVMTSFLKVPNKLSFRIQIPDSFKKTHNQLSKEQIRHASALFLRNSLWSRNRETFGVKYQGWFKAIDNHKTNLAESIHISYAHCTLIQWFV